MNELQKLTDAVLIKTIVQLRKERNFWMIAFFVALLIAAAAVCGLIKIA